MKKGKHTLTRRRFLAGAAAVLGGAVLAGPRLSLGAPAAQAEDPVLTPRAYLPLVAAGHPPPDSRVVHVQAAGATHWDGEMAYWQHVDPQVVNDMVDQGVMALTGTATVADAWRAILPAYQAGQKVAIKVNLNNCRLCDDADYQIDALPEPVNAVVLGLEQIGVARADVCVYDAIRAIPDRFMSRALAGVGYFDGSSQGVCRTQAGFSYTPASRVSFYPPHGVTVAAEYVTDVLVDAAYLINMPIMKGGHPIAGVTLGFKNHFGTVNNPSGLHGHVDVVGKPSTYRSDYNPLVDLLRSPLIGGKTVLTIGDALFAARVFSQAPVVWDTFGGSVPNSLFLSRDPVAVDCVMHDFVAAEPGTGVPAGADDYLRLAAAAGLGTFESVNPHVESYAFIDYQKVVL